jgi:hypothetical protein
MDVTVEYLNEATHLDFGYFAEWVSLRPVDDTEMSGKTVQWITLFAWMIVNER